MWQYRPYTYKPRPSDASKLYTNKILNNALAFYPLLANNGGYSADILTPRKYGALSSGSSWLSTQYGIGIDFPASTTAGFTIANALAPKISGKKFSLSIIFVPHYSSTYASTSGNWPTLLDTTSLNNNGIRIFWEAGTAQQLWRFRLPDVANLDATPTAFSAGEKITLTCVYDPSVGMSLRQNGRLIASNTTTGTITEPTDDWLFGNTIAPTSVDEAGYCTILGIILTEGTKIADINAIAANPWEVFKNKIWVPPAAGGPFNAAWARGCNSLI
jgi:hypothetical protein